MGKYKITLTKGPKTASVFSDYHSFVFCITSTIDLFYFQAKMKARLEFTFKGKCEIVICSNTGRNDLSPISDGFRINTCSR